MVTSATMPQKKLYDIPTLQRMCDHLYSGEVRGEDFTVMSQDIQEASFEYIASIEDDSLSKKDLLIKKIKSIPRAAKHFEGQEHLTNSLDRLKDFVKKQYEDMSDAKGSWVERDFNCHMIRALYLETFYGKIFD